MPSQGCIKTTLNYNSAVWSRQLLAILLSLGFLDEKNVELVLHVAQKFNYTKTHPLFSLLLALFLVPKGTSVTDST